MPEPHFPGISYGTLHPRDRIARIDDLAPSIHTGESSTERAAHDHPSHEGTLCPIEHHQREGRKPGQAVCNEVLGHLPRGRTIAHLLPELIHE
ncbi:MAG: hypothetical protein KDB31_01950, partial [Microthrixaceae bacterium]|nr:hypothetical protein [Microthrixaceae bacterium]